MELVARTRGKMLLTALAVLGATVVLYGSIKLSIEPYWLLAGMGAVVLALTAMRKWPVAVVAALLFVGNFKTTAAQGFSFADPTVVLLLLSAGAIVIELLFVISGDSEWSLQDALRGQQAGILSFIIFVTVVAVSYLYTSAPNYGWVKLSRFLAFKPLVFFAPFVLLKRERDVRQFLVAFFILGLALTAKDVYGFLHPTKEILSGDADTTRIGDAQLIGMTLLILFFSSHFRRFPKFLGLAVVLFLAFGMVVATARGPLLSVLFVLFAYSFIGRRIKTFVSYKQMLAGLLIFGAVIMAGVSGIVRYPAVQARVLEKQQELTAFFQGARDPGGTMQERLVFYRSAVSAFAERPLSGWGVGGWPVFFYGAEREDYPHNLILEIAAEQGYVGLMAFFAFLIAISGAGRRIWRLRPDLAFTLPLFSYSFLACMFSSDLNTRTLWFWAGAIFALSRMCESKASGRLQARHLNPSFLIPESVPEYSRVAVS